MVVKAGGISGGMAAAVVLLSAAFSGYGAVRVEGFLHRVPHLPHRLHPLYPRPAASSPSRAKGRGLLCLRAERTNGTTSSDPPLAAEIPEDGGGGEVKGNDEDKERRFLFSRRLFKMLDKNQDGKISASEVVSALGIPHRPLAPLFCNTEKILLTDPDAAFGLGGE
uniref:EF-hand domain-containing protein n=2 Tax=Hemiselmis andersenii TaxID=464988 RepID=A0A7S0TP54_HEMAN|mmetsp:Transcript_18977/g.43675  ORF Transcript_18977/g.43675 Transcript_18977/m.43675 type:complete len:166 (+) Transcript_18977:57-554(+)